MNSAAATALAAGSAAAGTSPASRSPSLLASAAVWIDAQAPTLATRSSKRELANQSGRSPGSQLRCPSEAGIGLCLLDLSSAQAKLSEAKMGERMARIQAQGFTPFALRLLDEICVAEDLPHDHMSCCIGGVTHQPARANGGSVRCESRAAEMIGELGKAQ